ncbi:hypothetical protein ASF57_07670 [Methylobacterium sp. Leaf117]|nr:hypothetical protein ASF57_07670 [Methylobacterium sp. Leaf117]
MVGIAVQHHTCITQKLFPSAINHRPPGYAGAVPSLTISVELLAVGGVIERTAEVSHDIGVAVQGREIMPVIFGPSL